MAQARNIPISIGVPGGAPNDLQSVAAYLTQLVGGLNNWISQAATAINFGIVQAAPAHSNSTGTAGQLAMDSSFFYVCVATNLWKRIALPGGTW